MTMSRRPPDDAENPGPRSELRARAIVIGCLLATSICLLTPFNNAFRQATPLGGGHFPLAPFYIFFWLTLLCHVQRRLLPRWNGLTGRELIVIWMLMMLVSGIAYTGLVRTFFINLTAPFRFATVENRWEELLIPLLPSGWYPESVDAVARLYDGIPGGRSMGWLEVVQNIPWDTWVRPLLTWSGFILTAMFVMVCLVSLFSRQWLRNERMNFPLLRVPLLMEEAYTSRTFGTFLLNRFLLAGIAVPVSLHLLNGLSFYYPSVPQIPTLVLAAPYFSKFGLFSGLYKLKIHFYPAFIGFAFLTTRQISFSFWFFFLMGGLLFGLLAVLGYEIPPAALGTTFGPTLTRPEEMQMIGAYGVFFFFIIWLSRHHLVAVVKEVFGMKKPPVDETGFVSIRFAFWGFTVGSLLMMYWLHRIGMPITTAFLLIGAFFMILLVVSRIIAQGGLAYFTLTAAPLDGLTTLFGHHLFTGAGIVAAAVIQKAQFLDLRESLMPSLVHANRISSDCPRRGLVSAGIGVTLVTAVAVSLTAMLVLSYKYGIRELGLDWATRTTVHNYDTIVSLLERTPEIDGWVRRFSIAGAVIMVLLVIGYHRFYWWPLHPIGYLTAYSSGMRILWFSFLVGWLCNSFCMRYGGVVLFKKLRFFFIGLIIGDFLMGGSWAIVGLFTDASYQVLPN